MIFEQTLTVFQSLIAVTIMGIIILLWRFFVFWKKGLEKLSLFPSIIVLGPSFSGKTSLVKAITKSKIRLSPLLDGLGISGFRDRDKKIQVLDVKMSSQNIKQLKNLNLKTMVYVFDTSSNIDSLKNQIKEFESFKKIFRNVKQFIVLNKIDIADKQTLKEIKRRFKDFYEVSAKTNEGLDKLRASVVSSLSMQLKH